MNHIKQYSVLLKLCRYLTLNYNNAGFLFKLDVAYYNIINAITGFLFKLFLTSKWIK